MERRQASSGDAAADTVNNNLSSGVAGLMGTRRVSDNAEASGSSPYRPSRSGNNSGTSSPRPTLTPRSSSRHNNISSPKLSPSQIGSIHDGHAYSEAATAAAGPGPEGSQATMAESSSYDTGAHVAEPQQQTTTMRHSSGDARRSDETSPAFTTANGNQNEASQSSSSHRHTKERSGGGSTTAGAGAGTSGGRKVEQFCDACGKPMTGQFVRALGVVYHLDCFRCRDCNKVVAAKFFPATDEMSSSPGGSQGSHEGKQSSPTAANGGKLFPLCEVDYFRRLDLLCANCGGALRGSYITALGKKFHVEHFTCSICPTVFGPQDSYYEHDGRVFCHFHYSTRFAIRCTGCRTAILKQFVEINRNNQDEHWHPECYMIHKFWNIKLCPTGSTPRENVAQEPTTVPEAPEPKNSGVAPVSSISAMDAPTPEALETEASETPSSLKEKQKSMEEQVYRIWTVLSAFEESSAACISDMLKQVSTGKYLGGVRMAERFILHVEVLFAAIDSLEDSFRKAQAKGISHIREARMLCKKVVNFFSLLSHTQETGAQRMGITQELLSLVTGLAHYLKILIRIALTGALRLERDFDDHDALGGFLDRLASLALAQEENSPQTKATLALRASTALSASGEVPGRGAAIGYGSLPRSTSSSMNDGGESATDLCVACGRTVEEECVRININLRWHTACVRCQTCKRPARRDPTSSKALPSELNAEPDLPEAMPSQSFSLDIVRKPQEYTVSSPQNTATTTYTLYCRECKTASARNGFERVSRLEQYSYLLRVALNRLYALLKKRGVVPASPPASSTPIAQPLLAYNDQQQTQMQEQTLDVDANDLRRMKSVNLERRLSTKAKVPHISTVVGSPSGHLPAVQKQNSPITGGLMRKTPSPTPIERQSSGDMRRTPRRSHEDTTPHAPSQLQHGSQSDEQHQQQQQPYVGTRQGPIVPIRPAFARHNTDVRIQDQGPIRQPSGDDAPHIIADPEEQLTLADIPQLLQQEQAREQHRRLPSFDGRAIADLSALELFVIKHMAVLLLQQSPLKEFVAFDELIDFIDIRKNTFWGKLFKGGKDKKKVEKKGTFNIPLDVLVDRSGADCTYGSTSVVLRVPSFIDDIISAMRQMDVTVEGIFRKNGNIRRLKELSEALDRDSASINLSEDNPVQLAALLKKWLRELPDPLLTFKLHKLFVMSQKLEPQEERLRCLHLLSVLLPKSHRDTMEVLFVFLRWVASFSHIDEETGSKMDLQNLAMVLGPNILYSKGSDPAKDELFLANRAILALLEYQDVFWRVPQDLEVALQDRELLNTSNELTSRDILKRCEKYARRARSGTYYPLNGHGGGSGSGMSNSSSHFNNGGRQGLGGGHQSPNPGGSANRGNGAPPGPGGGMFGGGGAGGGGGAMSDVPMSSSTIRSLADQQQQHYSSNNGGAPTSTRRGSQQSPTQNDYVRSPIDKHAGSIPPWLAAEHAQHRITPPRHPAGPPPPPPTMQQQGGNYGPPQSSAYGNVGGRQSPMRFNQQQGGDRQAGAEAAAAHHHSPYPQTLVDSHLQ